MRIAMPSQEVLPPGALRDMVTALHQLWRAAGMPSTRSVSIEIRKRNDLPDTVSHEVIAMLLRGGGLVKWQKFECVVRQLADWSVGGTHTADTTVREFHHLWLRAFDEGQTPAEGARPAAVETRTGSRAAASVPAGALDAAGDRPQAAHSLVHNLPSRNARFCGRNDSLQQIGVLLASTTDPVVIHGLGGVGKTHLALEYAHRHHGEYALIWWIPAGDESGLRRSVRDLADRLGLRIGRDLNHVVRVVVTHLESTSERWLLIFDNLEDEVIVDHALPAAGGDVLITTRNQGFPRGEPLAVSPFARPESVEFLERASGHISSAEANRVAELVGDLPLALAQVADVQAVTDMPWARYISLFDGHVGELLRDHRSQDHAGLAASLDLTFRRLAGNSPGALFLLEVLAHLGPAPVAVALLRNGRSGRLTPALARCLNDPRQLRRAVNELVRVGLVGLDADQGRVTMHRLVRDHARQGWGATEEARGRENARAVLTAADPGPADDERTWGLHALIAPHIRATELVSVPTVEAQQLILRQSRYLYQSGDYVASATLSQEASDAWAAVNSASDRIDDFMAEAARHRANALRALGEYEESRELTRQTLERLRGDGAFGPDHEVTLVVASSAGADLRIAGEYSAALEMERDTLERTRRAGGAQHAAVLKVQANLAVSLRLFGDFAAALNHDQDVLAKASRLGEFDGLGVNTVHSWQLNLAWDLYGLGRFDEMLAQATQAWSNLDPGLRPGHVLPLLAARTVAVALRCLGRPEAAEASRRSYENHLNSWGADHERSLAASISHVNSLRAQARFGEAWSLAVDVQDTYRRRFGWRHPVTAASSVVLAGTLRGLGRSREAQELDEPAFHDLTSILGSDHPYTVAAANGLAADRLATGSIAAAQSLAVHTADRAAHRYGEHPITSACRANAAVATTGVDGSWIELDVEPPPA